MKILYDVPCPCQEGQTYTTKYQEQYAKIFHFAHSDAREIEIDVDNPKSFIRSCPKAFAYIYPKFKYQTSDKKAKVIKTW